MVSLWLLVTGHAAPVQAADGGWFCEATVGTAYEYDAVAEHWQTRLFTVDQRWRFERSGAPEGGAGWRAVALSRAGVTLACESRADSRGRVQLLCGDAGQVRLDVSQRVMSVALGREAAGEQIARTAVGRCLPVVE